MTDAELDSLIRGAMDSGITHGLIPPETADLMRLRLAILSSRLDAGEEGGDLALKNVLEVMNLADFEISYLAARELRQMLKTRGYVLVREP